MDAHAASWVQSALPVDGGVLMSRDPLTGRERLVYGHGSLAHALRHQTRSLKTLVVAESEFDHTALERLAMLDQAQSKDLEWFAEAAHTLHALPLSLENVSTLLGLWGRADAQRLVRLAKRPVALRRAAVAAHVTRGHLRYLSTLDDAAFATWIRNVKAGLPQRPKRPRKRRELSIRELVKELHTDGKTEVSGSADIQRYAECLGDALGTQVRIHWPDAVATRAVSLKWYGVDTLVGIFRQLATAGAAAGDPSDPISTKARELILPLQTSDELEAVFGPLGHDR
ncbi:MAG: hypothetical protein BGP25_05185 [Lysobacterales bacterium 63-13]|nr:MAG: hypothetical protein BGP25_05185 [Xanthomonadales bacterium 63-13]